MVNEPAIVIAGQICVDIVMNFPDGSTDLSSLIQPGRCVVVEDSTITSGGAVSNTGLVLARMGVPVRLVGKIGGDAIGSSLLSILENGNPGLSDHLIVAKGMTTSYAIVLNPPGIDRSFLYVPGPNHRFSPAEVTDKHLEGARYFHLGYPTEMQLFYQDHGDLCLEMFQRVKEHGLTTSVDMALPDIYSESGRFDWRTWLQRMMPQVDMFLPSLDEITFMLRPKIFSSSNDIEKLDKQIIMEMASEAIEMGAALVLTKLGERGLYLQTSRDSARLRQMGKGQPYDLEAWRDVQLWCPSFKVNVKGTTGAGDSSVAGFLAAMTKGLGPEQALETAAAAGAASCEQADASSGVPSWEALRERITMGWERNS